MLLPFSPGRFVRTRPTHRPTFASVLEHLTKDACFKRVNALLFLKQSGDSITDTHQCKKENGGRDERFGWAVERSSRCQVYDKPVCLRLGPYWIEHPIVTVTSLALNPELLARSLALAVIYRIYKPGFGRCGQKLRR